MKPILLVLTGPPGSGKTHFAEKFSKLKGYSHLNSDQVRLKYFKNPQFTPDERDKVYDKLKGLTNDVLKSGKNAVFDGNLVTNPDRRKVFDQYKDLANVLFVYLDTPKDIALDRAINRSLSEDKLYKPMPENRAKKMHDEFEPIDNSLPSVTVNGTSPFQDQVLQVESTLK